MVPCSVHALWGTRRWPLSADRTLGCMDLWSDPVWPFSCSDVRKGAGMCVICSTVRGGEGRACLRRADTLGQILPVWSLAFSGLTAGMNSPSLAGIQLPISPSAEGTVLG